MKKILSKKRFSNQNGMATIVALFLMIMLTMIGIAVIEIANDEITIAGNEMNEMAAFYAAEAGLERASASIQDQFESTGGPPETLPSGSETIDGALIAYDVVDNGAAEQSTLTQGTLAGLHALVKTYSITSTGISELDHTQASISQEFQCALVPLFQFAVFYDNDLEIAPGPDMSIIGRIHSNGDIYLQAGNDLFMDSYVTCAGNLLHGRKGPGDVSTGNVFIKDTDGNYQNMKNLDGTFLSSVDTGWYANATNRWDGRVQDAAFGQEELNLPITDSDDIHKVIERYDGGANPDSYEQDADAKVIDGAYFVKVGGVWQDVTALLPAGTITSNIFYDHREGKNVYATDVDMTLLASSAYIPSNGVIYASDDTPGKFNALRLTNGDSLGDPLSVFSENPMYVQGDYNTVDKQPACLGADAITFLSNNWEDDSSTVSKPLSSRLASTTECNASIMTGNTNTTSSDYNGGLENLPRFLEDWSPGGVKQSFKFTGSLVNLWNSAQADGEWLYGSPVYEAPNRDWAYDTDLDDPTNLPPNTPQVQVFQRTGWRQNDIAYSDYIPMESEYDGTGL